jgi:hypothetical protein
MEDMGIQFLIFSYKKKRTKSSTSLTSLLYFSESNVLLAKSILIFQNLDKFHRVILSLGIIDLKKRNEILIFTISNYKI